MHEKFAVRFRAASGQSTGALDSLLSSLTQRDGEVLAVQVALKGGSLERARELLAKGPPLDPASFGLRGHEVYLHEGEAVAAAPRIVDSADVWLDPEPVYAWTAHGEQMPA